MFEVLEKTAMDVLDKELDKQIAQLQEEKSNAQEILDGIVARLDRLEAAKAALSGEFVKRRSGSRHLSTAARQNQTYAQKKRRAEEKMKAARDRTEKAKYQAEMDDWEAKIKRNREIILQEKAERRRTKG